MSNDPLSNAVNSVPPDKLETMREEMFSFRTSGAQHIEAANKFQAGLDKVIDVLLVLVMKFGRATSVLILGGLVLVVNLVSLVVVTIQIFSLRSEVRDLLDRQESFSRSQERIEKTANATQEKVEATQAKVDTAVETSPKIEVDKRTGKAKLIVPATPPKDATASSPAAEGTKKVVIPLGGQ
jgi:hypothetical protein